MSSRFLQKSLRDRAARTDTAPRTKGLCWAGQAGHLPRAARATCTTHVPTAWPSVPGEGRHMRTGAPPAPGGLCRQLSASGEAAAPAVSPATLPPEPCWLLAELRRLRAQSWPQTQGRRPMVILTPSRQQVRGPAVPPQGHRQGSDSKNMSQHGSPAGRGPRPHGPRLWDAQHCTPRDLALCLGTRGHQAATGSHL